MQQKKKYIHFFLFEYFYEILISEAKKNTYALMEYQMILASQIWQGQNNLFHK